jgi:hypothetical protein
MPSSSAQFLAHILLYEEISLCASKSTHTPLRQNKQYKVIEMIFFANDSIKRGKTRNRQRQRAKLKPGPKLLKVVNSLCDLENDVA